MVVSQFCCNVKVNPAKQSTIVFRAVICTPCMYKVNLKSSLAW